MSPESDKQSTRPVTIGLWLLLGCLLVLFAYELWLLRLPQIAFRALFYFEYYLVVFAVGAVGVVAIWRSRPGRFQMTLRQALSLLTLGVLLLGADSMARQNGPLQFCFYASESRLDSLADDLISSSEGTKVPLNETAGVYHIMSGQVVNDIVILRLDDSENSHEFYGFIRVSNRKSDLFDAEGRINGERFGLEDSAFKHLSGDWYVFYSHYWSIKIGPS